MKQTGKGRENGATYAIAASKVRVFWEEQAEIADFGGTAQFFAGCRYSFAGATI